MPGAGDGSSVAKTKGALVKEPSQSSSRELKNKLVEHLMNPAELEFAEQIVESIQTLA